jgi:hypothetical protein
MTARGTKAVAVGLCALILSVWFHPVAAQTGIAEICAADDGTMGGDPDTCGCALTALRETVGPAAFDVYAGVSATFLAGRAEGLGFVEAWDAGVAAEAEKRGVSTTEILETTNAAGRAHRDALETCRTS